MASSHPNPHGNGGGNGNEQWNEGQNWFQLRPGVVGHIPPGLTGPLTGQGDDGSRLLALLQNPQGPPPPGAEGGQNFAPINPPQAQAGITPQLYPGGSKGPGGTTGPNGGQYHEQQHGHPSQVPFHAEPPQQYGGPAAPPGNRQQQQQQQWSQPAAPAQVRHPHHAHPVAGPQLLFGGDSTWSMSSGNVGLGWGEVSNPASAPASASQARQNQQNPAPPQMPQMPLLPVNMLPNNILPSNSPPEFDAGMRQMPGVAPHGNGSQMGNSAVQPERILNYKPHRQSVNPAPQQHPGSSNAKGQAQASLDQGPMRKPAKARGPRRIRAKTPPWSSEFLNRKLRHIYETKLLPTENELSRKKQCYENLQRILKEHWPNSNLRIFGSTASGFAIRDNNDMDFAIEDTGFRTSQKPPPDAGGPKDRKQQKKKQPKKPPKLQVRKIGNILRNNHMVNVLAIPKARVPIVKFVDPMTDMKCDICVNNLLAVENTILLRSYADIDPRVKQLVVLVKHWAKSRRVNTAFAQTLSSYGYALMCIHLLQTCEPAILPCLQSKQYEFTVDKVVEGWTCRFNDRGADYFRGFGLMNKKGVAELLYDFFHYWAHCHSYKEDAISIRTGGWLSKDEKGWTKRKDNDNHLMCIEDPFYTTNDIGRVVSSKTIFKIRDEFRRAADILASSPDPVAAGLFDVKEADPEEQNANTTEEAEAELQREKRRAEFEELLLDSIPV